MRSDCASLSTVNPKVPQMDRGLLVCSRTIYRKRGHMLSDNNAIATVAVKNLEESKKFYERTLGLTKVMENDEVVAFKSGPSSTLFVYRSSFAGTNKATAVTFVAAEVDELVRTL